MGGYTKHGRTALTPYPSWGIWWPLGSLTLVWRVNWEAMVSNARGPVSIVQQLCSPRKADRVLLISMLGSGGLSVGEVRSTESNWARRTGKGVVFYKENIYSNKLRSMSRHSTH